MICITEMLSCYEMSVCSSITINEASKALLEGWYYLSGVTCCMEEVGEWRLGISIQETGQKLYLLIVITDRKLLTELELV